MEVSGAKNNVEWSLMTSLISGPLRLIVLGIALFLTACTTPDTVTKKPDPLGDFKLGHVVVVANQVTKGPLSRDATQAELVGALLPKLESFYRQFEGDKFYNISVTFDAYVLALPGIPLVASQKTTLFLGLTVWDDSAQKKLMEKPVRIVVIEAPTSESLFLGSGLTQTKEEQLEQITKDAVQAVHKWMVENKHLFEPAES